GRRPASRSTPTARAAAVPRRTRRPPRAQRTGGPVSRRSSATINHVLPDRSEVVVIGGGVVGAAALHYLVELGCRAPVLVERDTLASGSTGHCAGGVRTLFSDELNRRISAESIRR